MLGILQKPVGLKGMMKMSSLSDFPERFKLLGEVYLFDRKAGKFFTNPSDSTQIFRVKECTPFREHYRISFEGHERVESITAFAGAEVMIDEDERVDPGDENFFYYDLIGLDFYDKGKLLGKVEAIVDYGSGDLFRIRSGKSELLIPFVRDFIKEIDISGGRINADLIEGFI